MPQRQLTRVTRNLSRAAVTFGDAMEMVGFSWIYRFVIAAVSSSRPLENSECLNTIYFHYC